MDSFAGLIQDHNVRVFTDADECTTEAVISSLIADNIVGDDPIFIIDIGAVKRAYENWVELLPTIQPYFAMKSNSDEVILKVLAALGSSFDVASHNEISTALQHVGAERLVFAHPVKDTKTLSYARAVDVDLLTFDSSNELLKIALFHPNAELLLRLKVDDAGSACRFGEKFGAPPDEIAGLLSLAVTLGLSIVGFSFHVGSGATEPQLYIKAMEQCLGAMELAKGVGMSPTIIDIGGGFQSSTFEQFASIIRPFVDTHPEIRFIAEPGRLMVNDAATLIISIIGKKRGGAAPHVIYVNESVYGVLNNLVFDHRKLTIEPFNEREGERFRTKVFGRTCDSIDVISNECLLPDLAVGEKLFIRDMGAYTSASASSAFNGFHSAKTTYVFMRGAGPPAPP